MLSPTLDFDGLRGECWIPVPLPPPPTRRSPSPLADSGLVWPPDWRCFASTSVPREAPPGYFVLRDGLFLSSSVLGRTGTEVQTPLLSGTCSAAVSKFSRCTTTLRGLRASQDLGRK